MRWEMMGRGWVVVIIVSVGLLFGFFLFLFFFCVLSLLSGLKMCQFLGGRMLKPNFRDFSQYLQFFGKYFSPFPKISSRAGLPIRTFKQTSCVSWTLSISLLL